MGFAIKVDSGFVQASPPQADDYSEIFCPSKFRPDFRELVYYGETRYFLEAVQDNKTVERKLLKDGEYLTLNSSGLTNIVRNQNYGYHGDVSFGRYDYHSFILDFHLLYDAFGAGEYQVETTVKQASHPDEAVTKKSHIFQLYRYFDPYIFDKSVLLEFDHKGKHINTGIDYSPVDYKPSLRISGDFGYLTASIERDEFMDSSFRNIQNRETIIRSYILRARMVPESIYHNLISEDIMANGIKITADNLFQEKKYVGLEVWPQNFEDTTYHENGMMDFTITFGDRQTNIIKTNVN